MKKLIAILFIFSGWEANAQSYVDEDITSVSVNLSELALLSIMPDKSSVVFLVEPPAKAGNLPQMSISNNNKWINYTSALSNFSKSRKIQVQVTYGSIPQGLKLFVEAGAYTGNGKGTTGQSQGKVQLTTQAALLINNIKGAYTGRGAFNGHKLTYSIEITDPSQIVFIGENELQVTYTIADQ